MLDRQQFGGLQPRRMKIWRNAAAEFTSAMTRNRGGKALAIARTARDTVSGTGISNEYGVARYLVNPEVVDNCEGTHDIHVRMLAARRHRLSGRRR